MNVQKRLNSKELEPNCGQYHIVLIVCGKGKHSGEGGPILKYGVPILLKKLDEFCDISDY